MIKVGITGGIGSGKSLVCEIFSRLHVPVYNADAEARMLTDNDEEIRAAIIALTGEKVFDGNVLNRPLLASYIFNDEKLLEKVNGIIHPRVALHFNHWCSRHFNCPYIIQESAILFETNAYLAFDKIITVTCPDDIRIDRVIRRKEMSIEKVKAIMKNQLSEEEKIQRSQYTIINDGRKLVLPQVLRLHHTFITSC